ncbi:MAG: DUF1926 domain-containing protein, partial [Proteobacteria bacterium]|nr:DUF1926 domain-containing protein [Pseudomonadota bacterium]
GLDEIVVMGPGLSFGLDPNRGGVIFDLCHMDRALNLADTLTRRPEAYHHKLAEAGRNQDPGGEIASIHDQVKVKEEGLEKLLIYDPCTRASLRDHFFEAEPSREDFFAGQALESGDFLQAAYQVTRTQDGPDEAVATLTRTGRVGSTAVVVSKTLRAGRAPRLHVAYNLENTGPEPIETVYACEFCLTLYSDQDEDRYLTAPEIGNHHPVSETGREADLTRFELVNHGDGLKTTFTLSRPVNVSFFPLLNVSMSEDGFEKSYQGTVMHFCLPLRLEPGRPERLGFDIELKAI